MLWPALFAVAIVAILAWSLLAHRARTLRLRQARPSRPWPPVPLAALSMSMSASTPVSTLVPPVPIPEPTHVPIPEPAPEPTLVSTPSAAAVPAPREPDAPTTVTPLTPHVTHDGPAPAGTVVLTLAPVAQPSSNWPSDGHAAAGQINLAQLGSALGEPGPFWTRVRRFDVDPVALFDALPTQCRGQLALLAREPSSPAHNARFRRGLGDLPRSTFVDCATVLVVESEAAPPSHVVAVGTVNVTALFGADVTLVMLLGATLNDPEDESVRRTFDTALLASARAKDISGILDPASLTVDHPLLATVSAGVEDLYVPFLGTRPMIPAQRPATGS